MHIEIQTVPLSVVAGLLSEVTQPHVTPGRADGYHVSGLVDAVHKVITGAGKYDKYEDGPESLNIMAMGDLWEAAVRPYIRQRARQWGMEVAFSRQLTLGRVTGNMDAWLTGPDALSGPSSIVVDAKLRFAHPDSPKSDPENNVTWHRQFKAYCYMVGAHDVWVPSLWLPRGKPGAEVRDIYIQYTQGELEANWNLLTNVMSTASPEQHPQPEGGQAQQ